MFAIIDTMSKRKWTDDQLTWAVTESKSIRSVIAKLGLVPAGGNYHQVKRRIAELGLSTTHLTGKGWNVGLVFRPRPVTPIKNVLVKGTDIQSNTLKRRLFREGILLPRCELCGWAELAPDGRLPVELDHINGDRKDNRLVILRILCPNCHSLQSTHRGKNVKRIRPGGEIGSHA